MELDRRPPPSLAYTIAFDAPGAGGARQMAKLLASSVLRSCFDGDLLIFHNSEEPIFYLERKGVEEVYVETPPLEGDELAGLAMRWKARARRSIDTAGYGHIVFLDADCLMLRSIDHLLVSGEDILYQVEPGRRITDAVFSAYLTEEEIGSLDAFGVNSGTWAVRAEAYQTVMEEWERIQDLGPREGGAPWREQSAWNRLLLDRGQLGLTASPFESREIQFPLHLDRDRTRHTDAAILHFLGGQPEEKLQHMFGAFMQRFYFDPKLTLFNILET